MNIVPDPTPPDDAMALADAARLTGRSVSWIRRLRRFGPLVATEIDGKQAVTRSSLLALMRRQPKPQRRRHLRLIVDNTAK